MKALGALQDKPKIRRVCADFSDNEAVELDMLEVQIGINRAARNKSERDAALMEPAFLSLRKHVEAYSGLVGDKYPNYQSLARWLESSYLHEFSEFLIKDSRKQEIPMISADSPTDDENAKALG